jgi:hypothetical protein
MLFNESIKIILTIRKEDEWERVRVRVRVKVNTLNAKSRIAKVFTHRKFFDGCDGMREVMSETLTHDVLSFPFLIAW